jgi:hypothetical protein
MLVPLHLLLETVALAPLLEGTALMLLPPRPCTLATGATALMVPLGEAVALLPFSRHCPAALALVTPIEAVPTAAETRPVRPSSAQLLVRCRMFSVG